MRRLGIWKSVMMTGMLVTGMGLTCSCGLQSVQPEMEMVGYEEKTTGSDSQEQASDSTASEENKQDKTEGNADKATEETVAITEEELRHLIDENIKCHLWIVCGGMPIDPTADESQNERLVDRSLFADYASFETYIRSVYCKEEADHLLYNFPMEGVQKFFNKDGMLYFDLNYDGGKGYYVNWENYTVTIDSVDGDSCTFTVTASVEWPSDEPQVEPYTVTTTAVLENGSWVLSELFE